MDIDTVSVGQKYADLTVSNIKDTPAVDHNTRKVVISFSGDVSISGTLHAGEGMSDGVYWITPDQDSKASLPQLAKLQFGDGSPSDFEVTLNSASGKDLFAKYGNAAHLNVTLTNLALHDGGPPVQSLSADVVSATPTAE